MNDLDEREMTKIDYKKQLKHLYNPSAKEVTVVNVPRLNFLMTDGAGDPNKSEDFLNAVEALYGLAYALKFMIKKGETGVDYGVLPLEGLWWTDDPSEFNADDKDAWKWTLMIMQPEFVTKTLYDSAVEQVREKKNPVALSKIRFEALDEGRSAQILHIGPFSEERPTIEKIINYAKQNGFSLSGNHHEIYLSDYRKTAPEKLKTIIRYPIS
jgi:hypothetical protein